MIKIPIEKKDIEWAKEQTIIFDNQKTHNKYSCDNNYQGILGEKLFHDWLAKKRIEHEWLAFIKRGWNDPDFIINNNEIDVKTTTGVALMVSKVQFDYYIFTRVNPDMKTLYVISYISSKKLQRMINEGRCNIINKDNGKNYLCPIDKMKPFEGFFPEMFPEDDSWTPEKIRMLNE